MYCRQEFTVFPKHLVKDGTKCRYGPKNNDGICVVGKCMVFCYIVSVCSWLFVISNSNHLFRYAQNAGDARYTYVKEFPVIYNLKVSEQVNFHKKITGKTPLN